MDNRNRLIHLKLLPLMMELVIADIMFLIKSMRSPTDHFNIYNFVEFSSRPTRSCSNFKLKHSISRTKMEGNFYFNRIPRLWNSLPTLDANPIKYKLHKYFWDYFIGHFDTNYPLSLSLSKVFVTTREHAFRQLFNLTLLWVFLCFVL